MAPTPDGGAEPEGVGDGPAPPEREPRLALGTRFLLFGAGWILVLIGVVGLALPGIQGILTILVGAAVLSLVSESVYRLLRRLLHRRFPGTWQRLDRFRQKVRDRLHRR